MELASLPRASHAVVAPSGNIVLAVLVNSHVTAAVVAINEFRGD